MEDASAGGLGRAVQAANNQCIQTALQQSHPTPFPRRILTIYIIDMQYPRVVGAYPAAGQFLRADIASIILYSKERVGNYPAVIYNAFNAPVSLYYPHLW